MQDHLSSVNRDNHVSAGLYKIDICFMRLALNFLVDRQLNHQIRKLRDMAKQCGIKRRILKLTTTLVTLLLTNALSIIFDLRDGL